ncbi:uncharacterized protein N7459_007032 [Penicillium hispanicum]|uniref:uncharacterized protein n=1 Tax=Penicillium hispanicum TaxID=1080232 RepID=UPI0025413CB8|nr:uncharacterized protein N7459_007032 [Penicillium hispanicum]KAJ5578068.1 hypothetical protein N7459_007032 [Penicillium hispanicum]
MLYASNLKLKKPAEVSDPRDEDFPVPYLPLEQGWRCEAPRCRHLCVSTKRMETHWSAVHGCKGNPSRDWSPAPLQTFFRGNMLHYFTTRGGRNRQTGGYGGDTQLSTKINQGCTSNPAEPTYTQKMRDRYALDPIDSLTLEHYFYSSYKSFVTDDQTETIWLNVVADLAYRHSFVLHGILACTALHMAHLYPSQCHAYSLRACAHQDRALPRFRYAIDHPTAENCDAIMAFAYLLTVYSFATEVDSTSTSFLVVDDTGTAPDGKNIVLPQWLHFIRTGCVMLSDVWDRVESGPVSALAAAWETELDVGDSKLPYLNHFLSFVPEDSSWSQESKSIYVDAARALAESFAYLERAEKEVHVNMWCILELWPVRVEDELFDLISERHPGSLILLAYYCVILKKAEECWYFGGRPARLIASIVDVLDTKWHPCVQEAVDQVVGPKER